MRSYAFAVTTWTPSFPKDWPVGLTSQSPEEHVKRGVLLTLDKGLGDIRRFPPRLYSGLVVFRLSRQGRAEVRRAVLDALPRLRKHRRLSGRLIIVTDSAIRVRR